jgi:hypothetical protein
MLYRRTIAPLWILAMLISHSSQPALAQPCGGGVAAEQTIRKAGEAHLRLELIPPPVGAQPASLDLNFEEQAGVFAVIPNAVSLFPYKPLSVIVRVQGQNPGAVLLRGRALNDPGHCFSVAKFVDTGFDEAVGVDFDRANRDRFTTNAAAEIAQALDRSSLSSFMLQLISRETSKPMDYELPVTARLSSTDALFSSNTGSDQTWNEHITLLCSSALSSAIFIKPRILFGKGQVNLDFLADSSPTAPSLGRQAIFFLIEIPLFLRILTAVGGGLLYALLTWLAEKKTSPAGRLPRSLAIAAGIGLLAAVLAEAAILPVKISKLNPWGYLMLGVLFASLGLDGILKRITKWFGT